MSLLETSPCLLAIVAAVACGGVPDVPPVVVGVHMDPGMRVREQPSGPVAQAPDRAEVDAAFDRTLDEAKRSCSHVITWQAYGFGAADSTHYFLDAALDLSVVEHQWSSEAFSGGGAYIYRDGAVVCFREFEQGRSPESSTLASCSGVALAFEGSASGAGRTLTPEEYSHGLTSGKDLVSKLRGVLPDGGSAADCSVHMAHEPRPVNEQTRFTPTTSLVIPPALCPRLDALEENLAAAHAGP